MPLTIQRINFNPVTGDNPSEGFMKTDLNIVEIATAIDGDGTPENPGVQGRIDAVEGQIDDLNAALDGLGNASARDVGTAANTVAAGDDARFASRGRRQLLINGDTAINQLVFAGGAMGANSYGYDMWRTFGAAASFTRSADGSTLTLNGTIGQVLEAPALPNATVTASVRNPSGPITVNLRPDATTAGATGVIPAGSGIQSVTLAVPASLTGNVFLQLVTTAAVSFDGPSKQGGIQLELGSFASNFEKVTPAEAMAQCQRYYWKSFRDSVAPGNGTGSLTGAISYVVPPGGGGAGVFAGVRVPFPQRMRAIPALTFFNPLGFSVNWINVSQNANSGSVSIGPTGTSELATFLINQQVSTDQTPHTICVHMVADARL
ncbi:hypothetical protein HBF26_17350 [Luteibacter jiangsuensis]|uniref:Tail fiber protein n=1 Tax=Luteibacter jiangsuensis TaxID=637577 RepID=A0ABX0Q9W7_9GAMM|nr:hypothetical protein [Luteibacter jiangsuensis]NID06665.1 hypothetical protein [Luteibacter jiangsuensis]